MSFLCSTFTMEGIELTSSNHHTLRQCVYGKKKIRNTQLLIANAILCITETIDTIHAIHEKFPPPLPHTCLLGSESFDIFRTEAREAPPHLLTKRLMRLLSLCYYLIIIHVGQQACLSSSPHGRSYPESLLICAPSHD